MIYIPNELWSKYGSILTGGMQADAAKIISIVKK
jgi:hypothetical protein